MKTACRATFYDRSWNTSEIWHHRVMCGQAITDHGTVQNQTLQANWSWLHAIARLAGWSCWALSVVIGRRQLRVPLLLRICESSAWRRSTRAVRRVSRRAVRRLGEHQSLKPALS